ncbi:4-oxalocrotonate tautomerase [Methanobacterium lacus]|uniref:4-oxalocrotonate tautomerase n=1 Tax=Methanobacterium lacus (strain AL-21) TaxID=877455 RepID=F0T8K9_METLA|nr:4-oxalocrotonate tautomerase [Methanobacterium lacus]
MCMVINVPVLNVNVWKGFEQAKIDYLIENLTKVFVDVGISAEAVEVIIHEVPQSHWGLGGVPCTKKFKDMDPDSWKKMPK